MPDRTVCAACRKAYWGFEGYAPEEHDRWLCPAAHKSGNRSAILADNMPANCLRLMEQAMAAAQPDVDPSKWAKLAKKAGAKPVDF